MTARKRAEEWVHSQQMAHIGEKYYQYSPPTIEAFYTMHGPLIVLWEHDDNEYRRSTPTYET